MRVLIVKTSSMGDVIHTLPALTDAMQTIANIRFDWVVEEGFAQIPTWHPAVNDVIPVAIRRWRKQWFGRSQRQERRQFKEKIKQHQYDAIIDAQGLLKSALLTRLASGIKHGYDRQSIREPLASWFYTKHYNVSKHLHAVERIRLLFANSLGYTRIEKPGNYAIAERFLTTQGEAKKRYLLFLHATTRAEKHWPETHWRELLERLSSHAIQIKLPWNTPLEHQRAIRLADGLDFVEVLPRMTLEQMAFQLAGATAVLSVDTGLSHLAAALSRPNITLYGPTVPGLIGGYGCHQQAVIAENGQLSSLSASDVLTRLSSLL